MMETNHHRYSVGMVLLAALACLATGALAQVGSQDIGRETLRMLREKRTGQSTLQPRRQQSKGAPKRIWQIEREQQEAKKEHTELQQEEGPGTGTMQGTEEPRTALTGPGPVLPTPTQAKPGPATAVSVTPPRPSATMDGLNLVPADAIFCVQINNLQATLGQLESYLAGVGKTPLPVAAMAQMWMGAALGDAELKNVEMQGQMVLFGVAAEGSSDQGPMPQVHVAMLLPVTDYGSFAAGNPNIGPADASGLSTIAAQDSPMGDLVCTSSPDPRWAGAPAAAPTPVLASSASHTSGQSRRNPFRSRGSDLGLRSARRTTESSLSVPNDLRAPNRLSSH